MDFFAAYRNGLANLLFYLLGVVSLITLVVVVVCIMHGDREAARKFGGWFLLTVFGFALLKILVSVF